MIEDLIYDVGLHTAEDTAYYLSKGYRVVAFEANPELVLAARERFQEEIARGQLAIVEGAIMSKKGLWQSTVPFFLHPSATYWSTANPVWARRNQDYGQKVVEIEVVRVDFADKLREYGVPYYLKIDIEGLDLHCVNSLLEVPSRPAFTSVEAGVGTLNWNYTRDHLRALRRAGYDRFCIVNQLSIPHQNASKQTLQGRASRWSFIQGSSGLFGTDLPGPWRPYWKVYLEYFLRFTLFRWFGFSPGAGRTLVQRVIRGTLLHLFHYRIPCWFDTHATTVTQLKGQTSGVR